jgi:hypothetical protein
VYVRPIAGSGAAVPISSAGGTSPIWSQDGRTIFYAARDGVMSVSVSACGAATPCDLGPAKPVALVRGPWIPRGAAPDGRVLVERASGRLSDVTRLQVTLQWTSELQRLVPPAVVASPK